MKTGTRRFLLALPTAAVIAALTVPAAVAATPAGGSLQPSAVEAAPAPSTQGIIMRDGGICNPRWGC
jgi:hypothetical protein